MYDIVLDYGHGGSDSGAVSNGLVEKNMNLITGLECARILEMHGLKVLSTRTSDLTMSLNERVKIANKSKAKLFVSIHYNAGGGDGAEAIHSIYMGIGEVLAKLITEAINKYTGQNLRPRATYTKVGSDKKDYFAVIRDTNMDAVIVESGFIDSKDRYIFDTPDEQRAMGRAIAYGILRYLNIPIVDSKTTIKPSTPVMDSLCGIVTADVLNIRAGRGAQYEKIGSLKKNTKVKLCYYLQGWWSIDYGSTVGYVSGEYIKKL